MNIRFFLKSSLIYKLICVFLLLIFIDFTIAVLFLLFLIGLLILFRKNEISEANYRTVDSSLFLSPIDGHVTNFKENNDSLAISVPFYRNYGVCMPITGTVVSFFETIRPIVNLGPLKLFKIKVSLKINSEEMGAIGLKISNLSLVRKSNIWVRSGDIALRGAYIGYLPFGGKIVIELKENLKVLIKKNTKVQAMRTILASYGSNND